MQILRVRFSSKSRPFATLFGSLNLYGPNQSLPYYEGGRDLEKGREEGREGGSDEQVSA